MELMWLTGRLVPCHKTIADFRRDNGAAIRRTCAQFVQLCRLIGLLTADQLTGQQKTSLLQEVMQSAGFLVAGAGFEPATFRL